MRVRFFNTLGCITTVEAANIHFSTDPEDIGQYCHEHVRIKGGWEDYCNGNGPLQWKLVEKPIVKYKPFRSVVDIEMPLKYENSFAGMASSIVHIDIKDFVVLKDLMITGAYTVKGSFFLKLIDTVNF